MRGSFLRLAAGLALLVLLTGSGCTSDAAPEPTPLPSDPPSVSISASPTPTAPTLPPEAEGTSARAAKAFARHYFATVNYAALSGDTKDLRDLGTSDCQSCDAIANNIESVYTDGGHIASEDWQIRNLTVLQASPRRSVLSIGAFLAVEITVSADGSRTRREGGRQPMTMVITDQAGTKQVERLDLVT